MDSRLLKTFILGLLTVCLLTLLGIYHVWQHNQLVQMGGDLGQASEELERLQAENELLEAEYRTRRSSDRFLARAFQELKMKQPSGTETIVIERARARGREVVK